MLGVKTWFVEIKCRIPGTRPTYSPVNFTWEHVGQNIFLHFSNSLVDMLAKSLVNMLAKALVNMLAEALVNMFAKSMVNMLAEAMVNIHVICVTGEQVGLVTSEVVGLIFVFIPVYKFRKFMKNYVWKNKNKNKFM